MCWGGSFPSISPFSPIFALGPTENPPPKKYPSAAPLPGWASKTLQVIPEWFELEETLKKKKKKVKYLKINELLLY